MPFQEMKELTRFCSFEKCIPLPISFPKELYQGRYRLALDSLRTVMW